MGGWLAGLCCRWYGYRRLALVLRCGGVGITSYILDVLGEGILGGGVGGRFVGVVGQLRVVHMDVFEMGKSECELGVWLWGVAGQ